MITMNPRGLVYIAQVNYVSRDEYEYYDKEIMYSHKLCDKSYGTVKLGVSHTKRFKKLQGYTTVIHRTYNCRNPHATCDKLIKEFTDQFDSTQDKDHFGGSIGNMISLFDDMIQEISGRERRGRQGKLWKNIVATVFPCYHSDVCFHGKKRLFKVNWISRTIHCISLCNVKSIKIVKNIHNKDYIENLKAFGSIKSNWIYSARAKDVINRINAYKKRVVLYNEIPQLTMLIERYHKSRLNKDIQTIDYVNNLLLKNGIIRSTINDKEMYCTIKQDNSDILTVVIDTCGIEGYQKSLREFTIKIKKINDYYFVIEQTNPHFPLNVASFHPYVKPEPEPKPKEPDMESIIKGIWDIELD
jgi:hypothetical protein